MPELIRDEFNAYKKTLLQEHLYELLFKESSSSASTSASSMEMPPLSPCPSPSPELEPPSGLNLHEFEAGLVELVAEVRFRIFRRGRVNDTPFPNSARIHMNGKRFLI